MHTYEFDAYKSYTREEIDQIANDLRAGICKMKRPEVLTEAQIYRTEDEKRIKRRKQSHAVGGAINRIKAMQYKVRR